MHINNEFAKFQINGRTKAERQPEEGWKTVGRRLENNRTKAENNRTKAEKQPDEGWSGLAIAKLKLRLSGGTLGGYADGPAGLTYN